jgi:hypothetical protein
MVKLLFPAKPIDRGIARFGVCKKTLAGHRSETVAEARRLC